MANWKAIGTGIGAVALGAVGVVAVMGGKSTKKGKVNKKLTPADIEAGAHINLALERGTKGFILLQYCDDTRSKGVIGDMSRFTSTPAYSLHNIRYFAVRRPGQEPCFDFEVGRFVNGTVEIANVITDGPLVDVIGKGAVLYTPIIEVVPTPTFQAVLDFAAGKESSLQPSEAIQL